MRIITFVASSTLTPSARAALDFCIRARDLGHETILSGLIHTRETPGVTELGSAADAKRIPFRLLQQRYRLDPGLIGQMEMMFRRLKPDLYLSRDYVGAAVARMARFRPTCVAHNLLEEENPIETRWLGKRLLKLSDVVLAGSDARAEQIARCGVPRDKMILSSDAARWVPELLAIADSMGKSK